MGTLNERGFVLPLTIFLVIMLGISGMGFLHLDYLERLATLNEAGNFSAFYLASTGMERARENLKIPDSLRWTSVLNGDDPRYPTDTTPDPLLCPYYNVNPQLSLGCVIPSFQTVGYNGAHIGADGNPVTAPDMPFSGTFDDGSYSVRAYNDEEDGLLDGNGQLIMRAMGTVRGEQKVIEVIVEAGTATKLINCQNADPGAVCPDDQNKNTQLEHMEGRDPASSSNLPEFLPSYYRNKDNLPCTNAVTVPPNATLVDGKAEGTDVKIQSNSCYYSSGNITVSNVGNSGWSNVVVFSDKQLIVNSQSDKPSVNFDSSIFIALQGINIKGNL